MYSIIGAVVGMFMRLKNELLEWEWKEWIEESNDQLRLFFRPVKVRVHCPPQFFKTNR